MLNEESMPANNLGWCRALLFIAVPVACATGVEPELDDPGVPTAGTASEGGSESAGSGGMPGSSGSLPIAGTTVGNGGGGSSNGGGGKSGSGSGGTTAGSGGASGGSSSGGRGGTGSSGSGGRGGSTAGGSGGSGGSGGGGSGCTCAKTVDWVASGNVSFNNGDCVKSSGKTYLYTGTKMQTYMNGSCTPGAQMTWCTDSGNDFKFMLCE
jgi:hypothetical protein